MLNLANQVLLLSVFDPENALDLENDLDLDNDFDFDYDLDVIYTVKCNSAF